MSFIAALGAAAVANPFTAIGLGLSAIGSYRDSKPKKTPKAEPVYTDLRKIVSNAKAAGIHPLEAIRSGAGVAGVTSTAPRISSFTAVGNSFDQVGDFLTGHQRATDANLLAQAQLANIRADTARMGRVASSSLISQPPVEQMIIINLLLRLLLLAVTALSLLVLISLATG